MNQKNRELARRNTELLEEISRLTDIHSDILKENIKEKYNRTRKYNKLIEQIDKQISTIKEVLEESLVLKESLVQIIDVKENKEVILDPNDFKETMKILDTICEDENEQNVSIKKTKADPLKEKNQNKTTKKRRKSGL